MVELTKCQADATVDLDKSEVGILGQQLKSVDVGKVTIVCNFNSACMEIDSVWASFEVEGEDVEDALTKASAEARKHILSACPIIKAARKLGKSNKECQEFIPQIIIDREPTTPAL